MRIAAAAFLMTIGLAAGAEAFPVTPLSLNDGAMTVNFTAAPVAGAFVITDEIGFERLKGNTLIELFEANNDLIITFAQPVTVASFDFALASNAAGAISYETWLGGAMVGSGSGAATPPLGFFNAEGTLAVAGEGFDTLVLHSPDASAFAIDNLAVSVGEAGYFFTFDTPEPLTLVLFGAGMVALARRRKTVG
jgi:hypothetical protein